MPGEVPRVPLPKEHKAKVCIWSDLEVVQAEELLNLKHDSEEIRRLLAETFSLEDHQENSSSAIILDLYFFTVQFALDNGFNKEQLSAFFSFVKRTHEVCTETPFGNLEQCFDYFKELVLCHSVKRPPWSVQLFSPEQVRLVTDYVLNTYFRHFKLYKYVFTPLVKLDLSVTYVGEPETPEPEEETIEMEANPEGEAEQTEDKETQEAEQPMEESVEESAVHQELRKLITAQLNEEITRLRTSLDEQIRLNDETLQQKLGSVEGLPSGKGGRASGKARKK